MARLDALLESRRLYLDPELTLTRLARALHVPVKRLSAAINRSTGGNVSRHVKTVYRSFATHCRDPVRLGEQWPMPMLPFPASLSKSGPFPRPRIPASFSRTDLSATLPARRCPSTGFRLVRAHHRRSGLRRVATSSIFHACWHAATPARTRFGASVAFLPDPSSAFNLSQEGRLNRIAVSPACCGVHITFRPAWNANTAQHSPLSPECFGLASLPGRQAALAATTPKSDNCWVGFAPTRTNAPFRTVRTEKSGSVVRWSSESKCLPIVCRIQKILANRPSKKTPLESSALAAFYRNRYNKAGRSGGGAPGMSSRLPKVVPERDAELVAGLPSRGRRRGSRGRSPSGCHR